MTALMFFVFSVVLLTFERVMVTGEAMKCTSCLHCKDSFDGDYEGYDCYTIISPRYNKLEKGLREFYKQNVDLPSVWWYVDYAAKLAIICSKRDEEMRFSRFVSGMKDHAAIRLTNGTLYLGGVQYDSITLYNTKSKLRSCFLFEGDIISRLDHDCIPPAYNFAATRSISIYDVVGNAKPLDFGPTKCIPCPNCKERIEGNYNGKTCLVVISPTFEKITSLLRGIFNNLADLKKVWWNIDFAMNIAVLCTEEEEISAVTLASQKDVILIIRWGSRTINWNGAMYESALLYHRTKDVSFLVEGKTISRHPGNINKTTPTSVSLIVNEYLVVGKVTAAPTSQTATDSSNDEHQHSSAASDTSVDKTTSAVNHMDETNQTDQNVTTPAHVDRTPSDTTEDTTTVTVSESEGTIYQNETQSTVSNVSIFSNNMITDSLATVVDKTISTVRHNVELNVSTTAYATTSSDTTVKFVSSLQHRQVNITKKNPSTIVAVVTETTRRHEGGQHTTQLGVFDYSPSSLRLANSFVVFTSVIFCHAIVSLI